MRTIIFIVISFMLYTTVVIGQTKKIALRSHSGTNSTFTIYVPDDFGLGRNYEEWSRQQEAMKKKDTTTISTLNPNGLANPNYGVCTPQSTEHYELSLDSSKQDKPNSKQKKAPKQTKKTPKVQESSSNTSTNQVVLPLDTPKENKVQPQKTKLTQQGSMGILVLLLTIPALFFMVLDYFKKS